MASIYSGHSKGRYNWLTRRNPSGEVGRILWVVEDKFNQYAENRGMSYRLPVDGHAVPAKEGWQH